MGVKRDNCPPWSTLFPRREVDLGNGDAAGAGSGDVMCGCIGIGEDDGGGPASRGSSLAEDNTGAGGVFATARILLMVE